MDSVPHGPSIQLDVEKVIDMVWIFVPPNLTWKCVGGGAWWEGSGLWVQTPGE